MSDESKSKIKNIRITLSSSDALRVFVIFFSSRSTDAFLHAASVTGRASAAASSVVPSSSLRPSTSRASYPQRRSPCGPHDITRDVCLADGARGPTVRSRVVIGPPLASQRSPHNPSLCHSVRFLRVVFAALRVGCSMRLR